MKILVTGAGGTLACAFERVAREPWKGELSIRSRQELDVTRADSIENAIVATEPDVVINTAAYNAVDRAEDDPEGAMAVNAWAMTLLTQSCLRHHCVLVHFSTDYVFDGENPNSYDERAAPHPLGVYGMSKWEGERVLERALKEQGLEYYCIRTSRLFGPRGSSPDAKSCFPQIVMERITSGEKMVCIDAEESSPTFVDDLAAATLDLLHHHPPFGIYHRTNDGACTWYGFAREIQRLVGRKGADFIQKTDAQILSRNARRPLHSVLKSTKLAPLRSWQEALRDYLKR